MPSFDLQPPPPGTKTEFPKTVAGQLRRGTFLIFGAVAALCGVLVLASLAFAVVWVLRALVRSL